MPATKGLATRLINAFARVVSRGGAKGACSDKESLEGGEISSLAQTEIGIEAEAPKTRLRRHHRLSRGDRKISVLPALRLLELRRPAAQDGVIKSSTSNVYCVSYYK